MSSCPEQLWEARENGWQTQVGKKRSLSWTMLIKYPLLIWSLFFFAAPRLTSLSWRRHGNERWTCRIIAAFLWWMWLTGITFSLSNPLRGGGWKQKKKLLAFISGLNIMIESWKGPLWTCTLKSKQRRPPCTSKPPSDFQDINNLANTV